VESHFALASALSAGCAELGSALCSKDVNLLLTPTRIAGVKRTFASVLVLPFGVINDDNQNG